MRSPGPRAGNSGRTEGAQPAGRPDRVGRRGGAAVRRPTLAFAVLGGDSDVTSVLPSAGSAFGLGLLWGVIGGVLAPPPRCPWVQRPRAARRRRWCAASSRPPTATLRPLGALLIACAALGLVGWLVQVGADVDQVRAGRSTATALVEESLFVGEHGVHLAALAAGARFTADASGALGLPFPVDQAGDVPGRDGGLRIFSYTDAMPGTSSSRPSSCSLACSSSPRSTPASRPPARSAPRRRRWAPPGAR